MNTAIRFVAGASAHQGALRVSSIVRGGLFCRPGVGRRGSLFSSMCCVVLVIRTRVTRGPRPSLACLS